MITRRSWLGMSLASAALVGCRRPRPRYAARPAAPVGATFEVTSSSALLWAYAPRPGRVAVEFESGREAAIELAAERGNTGYVDVTGLPADTAHLYRLRFSGSDEPTPWHWFRTAPPPDADSAFRFVYGADLDQGERYDELPLIDVMASTPADCFVSLGDWPYSDKAPMAQTLEQFRLRHRDARMIPAVVRLLERLPVYAIYDDHEVRNDWDDAYRQEHPDRLAAGLRAWDEWFPLRDATRRYRRWRWGRHAECFLLDARLYRSDSEAEESPDKTMLGAEQKRWLFDGLRASTATFKLVLSSVPFDFGTTKEEWGAYRHERDELMHLIRDTDPTGTVLLTADQHWFAAHHYDGGIKEFQTGPLRAGLRNPPPQSPAIVARARIYNYGEVQIHPGPEPRLEFTARSQDGAVIYTETIAPPAPPP